MRRFFILFLGIFSFIVGYFFSTPQAQAAELDSSIVRLNRQKISEPSYPILIIIEPSTLTSSRTETTFRFTLGNGFSINATASNIATSTSDLPSIVQGHTLIPMPGLSATATSVSGQQVDFSISDLTDGNYYAFYITSGITNPSTARSYRYSTSTRDGGGEIDTTPIDAEVDVVANDNISVSASVPVKSGEAELNITANPNSGSTIHELDNIEATITYRSTASSTKPFTIIASWDKGTVINTSSQVEVFDYVVGSATNAYDSTQPSVDVQNRKITWYISNLPPTSQSYTVKFKLKVRSDIPESSRLSTSVRVNGSLQDATLPEDTVAYTVEHTVGPTATPSSATPTVSPQNFGFEYIRLQEVGNNHAIIAVKANDNARATLTYGLRPSEMNKKLQSLSLQKVNLFDIADLDPDTQYYFRITITNNAGKSVTSDIFIFKTALLTNTIKLDQLELFWKQLLLSKGEQPVIIPHDEPLTIKLRVVNPEEVDQLTAKIVKKGVLGINTFSKPVNEIETRLIETIKGEFVGELAMPQELGEYQLILTTTDIYGGLFNQLLQKDIFVIEPITLVDSMSGRPIESVGVTISIYSSVRRTFTPLDEAISFVPTTDTNGQLHIALPIGSYKLNAETIGYKPIELDFKIDRSNYYPKVKMVSTMDLPSYAQYHYSGFEQLWKFLILQIKNVAESPYGRAGLRMLTSALTLVLFITYLFMRHKVEKPQKKDEHVILHELFHVFTYALFSTGIVLTTFVFLMVLFYVGFRSAFPFFVLACFDIMLLDMIVVHVTHLRGKK